MTPGTLAVGLVSALSLVATESPESLRPVLAFLVPPAASAPAERVKLPAGTYRPLFAPDPTAKEIPVRPFELDRVPVTNRRFLAFVSAHPQWQRGRAARLFVDDAYLGHWAGPTDLGAAGEERPVTLVSWFAAKAFCEAEGLRLPTEAEWEYAASASETRADGRKDRDWSRRILDWYAKPSRGPERDVGQGRPDFHGVHDLHGLVWEWVLDFNSTLVTADSRRGGDTEKRTFCGAGAYSSSEPENYASFMRTAFRSSVEAKSAVRHLGFRCAKSTSKEPSS